MTLQKLNIPPKTDNAAKKQMVQSNAIGANETLLASEVNAIVNTTNNLVDAVNNFNKIDAFNFKGNVPTYANLPTTGLIKDDAYGVIADGLVYIYNGSAFPTSGNGLNLGLKPTSDSKVEEGNAEAVSGDQVYREVSTKIFSESRFDKNSDLYFFNKNIILDVVKNKDFPAGIEDIYIALVGNFNSGTTLIQVTKSMGTANSEIVAQYVLSNSTSYKTGIEDVRLTSNNNSGVELTIRINWDNASKNSYEVKYMRILKNNVATKFEDKAFQRINNLEVNSATKAEVNSEITSKIFQPKPFDLNFDTYFLTEGIILDIIKNSDIPSSIENLYIGAIRNSNTSSTLIQITKSMSVDNSEIVAQYIITQSDYKTGIENINISPYGTSGVDVTVSINWDKVPKNQYLTRYLKIDLSKLTNKFDDKAFERINKLENEVSNKDLLVPNIYRKVNYVGNNLTYFNNGFFIGAVKFGELFNSDSKVYLRLIKNSSGANGTILQFYNAPTDGDLVAQYASSDSLAPRTNKEILNVIQYNNSGIQFKVYVDWSKITVITNIKTSLEIDLSKLNYTFDVEAFKRIEQLEQTAKLLSKNPIYNVFGNQLPTDFKTKLFSMDKDLEICLVGDSLTGLLDKTIQVPNQVAKNLPPANNYTHWTYYLTKNIVRNMPNYHRYDDSLNVFSGTWQTLVNGKFDEPNWAGDWSVRSLVNMSNSVNAHVSFKFNTTNFEKSAIIFGKHPDGASCVLSVTQGNGNVLVSLDKVNWVEANGFTLNQKTNPTGKTEVQLKSDGETLHESNRMLWMKRVSDVGEVDIVLTKQGDNTSFIYYWGCCFWNGNSLFVTNLGRGGRNTVRLRYNLSDVANRKPDLVVFEMTLANENTDVYSDLLTNYNNYLFASSVSMKSISNDFTDFQLLTILPHGRSSYWNGNNIANDNYYKGNKLYNTLKVTNESEKVKFINMQEVFVNEAFSRNLTIEQSLTASNNEGYTSFTSDGVHFNNFGSIIFSNYLSALFYS